MFGSSFPREAGIQAPLAAARSARSCSGFPPGAGMTSNSDIEVVRGTERGDEAIPWRTKQGYANCVPLSSALAFPRLHPLRASPPGAKPTDQEISMNKALLISAAISLALSGAAFAKGGAHSKSSASTGTSAEQTAQFTENDCQMLTVESARSACLQSARSSGGSDASAVGTTSGQSGVGEGAGGSTQAKSKTKRSKKKAAANSDASTPSAEQR